MKFRNINKNRKKSQNIQNTNFEIKTFPVEYFSL